MEKYLAIDEQTLSDLALLGKPGRQSVYELFNKTRTQGGSQKLETLFRQPLSDEHQINERASVYHFFSLEAYSFPIDAATVGTLSYYMENDDVRSQIQPGAHSLGQKFRDLVAADADMVFVQDGVQAAIRVYQAVSEFVAGLHGPAGDSAAGAFLRSVEVLLRSAAFAALKLHGNTKTIAKLNAIQLAEIDKQVRFDHRELTLSLLDKIYELDVMMAVGQVARQHNFRFAKALPRDSGILYYKGVYHPHVEQAIPNDLHLDKKNNILFLTGANMAGKSTLMKSIGIALYLGHMGFPVAAAQFEFGVRDGIYTSINLADNLSMGTSHYYAEVLRVKEVAKELRAGKQLFVIFDELFRGTNVKDAHDATVAITRAFATRRGSQFIISTHIMEAGELLLSEPLPVLYRFLPTEMEGSKPVYTRLLKEGITADRQGMTIIRNEGILEILDSGQYQSA